MRVGWRYSIFVFRSIGAVMKRSIRAALALAALALALALPSCDVFGHGLFTKVDVDDIQYVGIWEYWGDYFANFTFKVTNSGLVDVENGYITVKIVHEDGTSTTDDIMFEYLGVGESATGEGDIQIPVANVKTWSVVDVKRYAPVGTIGG
jgi:hypothetical protein